MKERCGVAFFTVSVGGMFEDLALTGENILEFGNRYFARREVMFDREMRGDAGSLTEAHPCGLHPDR